MKITPLNTSVGTILGTTFGLFCYIYVKSNSNSKSKLNIIFDLDETLIYSDLISNYDNTNKSNISKPESYEIVNRRKIWIRPYTFSIIPILSRFNNLYLFTKATQPYAEDILTKTNLDRYFVEKKFRFDCKNNCKNNCKSIEIFPQLLNDKKNTILVDDKFSNKCEGEKFYHIPRFNCFVKNDIEMLKLFLYILWFNIKNDFMKYI
jgi:hypothetical protein